MTPLLLILLIVGAGEARAQAPADNRTFAVPAETMPQLGDYYYTLNTCIACGSTINSGITGSCDPGYEPVITSRGPMCAKDLKSARGK